jgi:hypothetical protein
MLDTRENSGSREMGLKFFGDLEVVCNRGCGLQQNELAAVQYEILHLSHKMKYLKSFTYLPNL